MPLSYLNDKVKNTTGQHDLQYNAFGNNYDVILYHLVFFKNKKKIYLVYYIVHLSYLNDKVKKKIQ